MRGLCSNRWLTAVVGLYQEEITDLIRQGAARVAQAPGLDVTARLDITLAEKLRAIGG